MSTRIGLGDRVLLTARGQLKHQRYRSVVLASVVAAVTAVLVLGASRLLPLGRWGVEAAGLGGLIAAKLALVAGGVVWGCLNFFGDFPPSGSDGTVLRQRIRWFNRPGHDYLIRWQGRRRKSWHRSKHLRRLKAAAQGQPSESH